MTGDCEALRVTGIWPVSAIAVWASSESRYCAKVQAASWFFEPLKPPHESGLPPSVDGPSKPSLFMSTSHCNAATDLSELRMPDALVKLSSVTFPPAVQNHGRTFHGP